MIPNHWLLYAPRWQILYNNQVTSSCKVANSSQRRQLMQRNTGTPRRRWHPIRTCRSIWLSCRHTRTINQRRTDWYYRMRRQATRGRSRPKRMCKRIVGDPTNRSEAVLIILQTSYILKSHLVNAQSQLKIEESHQSQNRQRLNFAIATMFKC